MISAGLFKLNKKLSWPCLTQRHERNGIGELLHGDVGILVPAYPSSNMARALGEAGQSLSSQLRLGIAHSCLGVDQAQTEMANIQACKSPSGFWPGIFGQPAIQHAQQRQSAGGADVAAQLKHRLRQSREQR